MADAHGVFITRDDRVFLIDRDAQEVIECTSAGAMVPTLGRRHHPRFGAPFNHPTDVAVAADGEIYVTDGYGNALVHRFDAAGNLVGSWGAPGRGPGEFSDPHALWIDDRDRVLIADRDNDRIVLFDREGRYVTQWVGFYHPMDVFVDCRRLVFVSDQTPSNSVLTAEGELIGRCRSVANGAHGICGNDSGELFLAELNPPQITKLALIA